MYHARFKIMQRTYSKIANYFVIYPVLISARNKRVVIFNGICLELQKSKSELVSKTKGQVIATL